MSSTRLRQKSIALSRIAYQIMNIICGIIVPRMLSPTSWNWGPKSGLFWGGVSGLTAIYLIIRLPETKGRSYGELDLLFEQKVPAWRFKSTKVDREFLPLSTECMANGAQNSAKSPPLMRRWMKTGRAKRQLSSTPMAGSDDRRSVHSTQYFVSKKCQ